MNNTTVERGHLKVNTLTIEDTIFDGLYFQGVPVTIEVIANHGYKFSHWKETSSKEKNLIINLVSDTTLTAIFIENDDLDYSAITINEVYNADLDTLQGTVDGHEWIELYNSSDEDINLEGLFMTDNEDLTRWMLPLNENSIILANDFLIVYADKDSTHTESLEANFKKLKKDDVVSLTKIIGPDTTVLSSLLVLEKLTSNGRLPDGSDSLYTFNFHTFDNTNSLYMDCNKDEKGEAIIDKCGICTGGNTMLEVDECVITDIFLNTSKNNLEFYPNPVESIIHLNSKVHWQLHDVNGVQLLSGDSDIINMSNISTGLYFLHTEFGKLKIHKL